MGWARAQGEWLLRPGRRRSPAAATQPIPSLPICGGGGHGLGREPLTPCAPLSLPAPTWSSPSHLLSVCSVVTVPPDVFFFSWLKGCVVNSFYTYLLSSSFLWKPQLVSGLGLCLVVSQGCGLERGAPIPQETSSLLGVPCLEPIVGRDSVTHHMVKVTELPEVRQFAPRAKRQEQWFPWQRPRSPSSELAVTPWMWGSHRSAYCCPLLQLWIGDI